MDDYQVCRGTVMFESDGGYFRVVEWEWSGFGDEHDQRGCCRVIVSEEEAVLFQ